MNQEENPGVVHRVALLGNHLPRQCGIATFTTDLTDAISSTFPGIECAVVAMNDAGRRHAYGDRVRFEIAESVGWWSYGRRRWRARFPSFRYTLAALVPIPMALWH